MKILLNIIDRIKAIVEYEKNKKKQLEFLKQRKRQFPNCILYPGSKIIQTELGRKVVVHNGVVLKNTIVGNHSYFAPKSVISYSTIGNFCSIGQRVSIGLAKHPTSGFISTYPAFFSQNNQGCLETFIDRNKFDDIPSQTNIQNDVWLGNNVIIPGGISIGSGAIIAAGSVVTKNIAPYSIYGGNPAKFIRYRFSEEKVDFLLKTAWWNLPDAKLLCMAECFDDFSVFRSEILKIMK